jgi:hypothetical protein
MPLGSCFRRVACLSLILTFCSQFADGQASVTGRITGLVTDQSGAVVSGARVILRNRSTYAVRETQSGREGTYSFALVQPGSYEVRCEMAGFKTAIRPEITVATQSTSQVDIQLELGSVAQTVVAEAREEILQTREATVSELVDRTKIDTLPTASRYFARFTELEPGVVQEVTPSSKFGGTGVGGFVNGMRLDSNTVTLDGASLDDPTFPGDGSGDTVHIPLDGIQEMRIVLSNGGPLAGTSTGGQINAASRSGGNEIHGSAFEYLRNEALNARDFFANGKPPFRQHIYGFSVGAPIVKDKHFIFGTYERYQRDIQVTFTSFRPTPLLLSQIPGGSGFGNLREALDAAFPPANPGFDPTRPLAEFTTTLPRILRDHIFLIRTDHQITNLDKLFFRAFYVRSFIDASGFSRDFPTATSGFLLTPQNINVMVGYTRIVKSNQINEFRASLFRLRNNLFGKKTPDALVSLGFNPDSTGPGGFPFFIPAGTGLPLLGQIPDFPIDRFQTVYQFSDTYSVQRGSHSIVLGGDFYRAHANSTLNTGLRPITLFVGFGSPFGFGSPGLTSGLFLLQQQNFFVTPPRAIRGLRRFDWAMYLGDTWRINGRLTLDLGLRYEYFSRVGDVNPELMNNLYQADANGNAIPDVPISDITRVALHQVGGDSGFPMHRRNLNNWGPRIGLAYRPFNRTVIRAGYSIFYSKPYFEQFNKNRFNPPFVVSTTIFFQPFGSVGNPATDGDIPNITGVSPGWKAPSVQSFNLTVEQAITPDLALSAAYVGNQARHLSIIRNPNLGDAPSGPRPNPSFGVIDLLDSVGISNYNSLQLQLKKRLSQGFSFQVSYTLSKNLDIRSLAHADFGRQEIVPSDDTNLHLDYGRSDFDIRNSFKANFYYELPFGPNKRWGSSWRGIARHALANWSVSGIGSIRNGFPFSIYSDQDLNGDGIAHDRAPIIGNPQDIVINRGLQFLDPDAIGTKILNDPNLPPSGRNIFTGPGVSSWDLAVGKKFYFTERVSLDFRSEMLNFLNHASFQSLTQSEGNTVAAQGGSFGRILRTAVDARIIQLSFRLSF